MNARTNVSALSLLRPAAVAAALLLGLSLAGCGDGGGDKDESQSQSTPNATVDTDTDTGSNGTDGDSNNGRAFDSDDDAAASAVLAATRGDGTEWDGKALIVHFADGSAEDPISGTKCGAAVVLADDEKLLLRFSDGEIDCSQR